MVSEPNHPSNSVTQKTESSTTPTPSTTTTTLPTSSSLTSHPTFGMIVMLGLVGTAAGFTMYTKRTSSMLKHLEYMAANQAKRKPKPYIGPITKQEWDKIRPRFDKDEFI